MPPDERPKEGKEKEEKPPNFILRQLPTSMAIPMNYEKRKIGDGASSPVLGQVRKKAPPICRVPALRKENMVGAELSKWSFSLSELFPEGQSISSCSDKVDSILAEPSRDKKDTPSGSNSVEPCRDKKEEQESVTISPNEWISFKGTILKRTESRNGREHQRFATNQQTGQLLRLTTGAVPIMKDGRILLISSNSKAEWILPKGGWESDESLEVSAFREVFEEGGILGALGPQLNDVFYETRKAKKRRIELEILNRKSEAPLACVSVQSANSSVCQSEDDYSGNSHSQNDSHSTTSAKKECLATRIRNEMRSNAEKNDETASVASIASDLSSSCTHICMKMFPMYVLEVRDHWPESGRARKIVDIDTAIEIMSLRPEFQKVLIEVKEKGLHNYVPGRIQPCVKSQKGDVSVSNVRKI
jgi:diphosphoinositol-polyphosphate diphosphatase